MLDCLCRVNTVADSSSLPPLFNCAVPKSDIEFHDSHIGFTHCHAAGKHLVSAGSKVHSNSSGSRSGNSFRN